MDRASGHMFLVKFHSYSWVKLSTCLLIRASIDSSVRLQAKSPKSNKMIVSLNRPTCLHDRSPTSNIILARRNLSRVSRIDGTVTLRSLFWIGSKNGIMIHSKLFNVLLPHVPFQVLTIDCFVRFNLRSCPVM